MNDDAQKNVAVNLDVNAKANGVSQVTAEVEKMGAAVSKTAETVEKKWKKVRLNVDTSDIKKSMSEIQKELDTTGKEKEKLESKLGDMKARGIKPGTLSWRSTVRDLELVTRKYKLLETTMASLRNAMSQTAKTKTLSIDQMPGIGVNKSKPGIRTDVESAANQAEVIAEAQKRLEKQEAEMREARDAGLSNMSLAEAARPLEESAKIIGTSVVKIRDAYTSLIEAKELLKDQPNTTLSGRNKESIDKEINGLLKSTELSKVMGTELGKAEKRIQSLEDKMSKMMTTGVSPKKSTAKGMLYDAETAIQSYTKAYETANTRISAALDSIQAKLTQIGNTEFDSKEFMNVYSYLIQSTDIYKKKLDELREAESMGYSGERIKAITADLERAKSVMNEAREGVEAFTLPEGSRKLLGFSEYYDQLIQRMKELAKMRAKMRAGRVYDASSYNVTKKRLVETAYEMQRLSDTASTVDKTLKATNIGKTLLDEVNKPQKAIQALYDKMERINKTGIRPSTRQIKLFNHDALDLSKSLAKAYASAREQIQRAMDEITTAQSKIDPSSSAAAEAQYSRLADRLKELNNLQRQLNESSVAAAASVTQVRSAAKEFWTISNKVRALSDAFRELKRDIRPIVTVTKKVSSGIKLIGNSVKSTVKGIGSLNKHFVSLLKHLSIIPKKSDNLDKSLKRMTRRFTTYYSMLRTRFRRTAVAAMFDDMQADLAKIAKLDKPFNEAISSMGRSAKALGAQLVASLQPLLTFIGPIVTAFIDRLTAASDAMTQFIARITGHEYYMKASKGQYDYVKSLEEAEKKTKSAKKATDEYKASVLGFDQLNKMEGFDDSDNDTDEDDTETDMTSNYAKVKTAANAINDIADSIYKAFKRGDFYGAGKAMAAGVNAAFSWLDETVGWTANAEKFTRWINNFIDTVNGFIHGIDPVVIGKAIGEVGNTFVEGFRMLTDPETGIDFYGLGSDIGNIILNAVQTFHWESLGMAIVQGVQAGVRNLNGILESTIIDETTGETLSLGGTIGRGIADMLYAAIDSINPEEWGSLIYNIVNNFASFLAETFAEPEKFAELGGKIGESINVAVGGINGDDLAEGITKLAQSIVGFAETLFNTVDWSAIWGKLCEVLNSNKIDGNAILDAMGITLLPALIVSVLTGGLSNLGAILAATLGGAALAASVEFSKWYDNQERRYSEKHEGLKGLTRDDDESRGVWINGELIVPQTYVALQRSGELYKRYGEGGYFDKKRSEHIADYYIKMGTAVEPIPEQLDAFSKSIKSTTSVMDYVSEAFPVDNGSGGIRSKSRAYVPAFADGGVIGGGQLFIANERGPELVTGTGNGNTVVANNDQLLNGMANAIVAGFRDVAREAVRDVVNEMRASSGDVVLRVGDEDVARSARRGAARIDRRGNHMVTFA